MSAKPPRAVEPGIILALGLVLAIGLKVASQGMGRAGRPMPQASSGALAAAPAGKSPSLAATMAEHLKQMEAPYQSLTVNSPAPPPAAEPLYTASAMRDPLQSLLPSEESAATSTTTTHAAATPTPQAPTLPPVVALQGLFWGGAVPTVIINGKVYGIGDTVSGATIRGIDRRGIELEFQGMTYLITMQGTTTMLSQELPWR